MSVRLILLVAGLLAGCGGVEGKDNNMSANNTASNNASTNNEGTSNTTNVVPNNEPANAENVEPNNTPVNNSVVVDGSRVISELEGDEVDALCAEFDEAAEQSGLADLDCLGEGYFAALETGSEEDLALQAACSQAYEQCLVSDRECSVYLNCSGTVDQLRSCEQSDITQAEPYLDAFVECGSLTYSALQEFIEVASSIEDTPECGEYEATCD